MLMEEHAIPPSFRLEQAMLDDVLQHFLTMQWLARRLARDIEGNAELEGEMARLNVQLNALGRMPLSHPGIPRAMREVRVMIRDLQAQIENGAHESLSQTGGGTGPKEVQRPPKTSGFELHWEGQHLARHLAQYGRIKLTPAQMNQLAKGLHLLAPHVELDDPKLPDQLLKGSRKLQGVPGYSAIRQVLQEH